MQVNTQMSKALFIILITFIIVTSACTNTTLSPSKTQLSTPQPATVTQASSLAEPVPSVVESARVEGTDVVDQIVSAPPGLKVIYLHEGNLWLWTEAGDNVMLTGTGDISTARLSNDGQLLAFMHRGEVWTIRMDGTDARLHITQEIEGGALWFAPNGSLLAVSTTDHIDVIDLTNATTRTVVIYPPLPTGYYPEVVWSLDSAGFKTVIPPNSENGLAEFLFVLVSGTKASLAKFSMVPPSESLPFISPDGGYVIYVAKLADEKDALHLMDSSGATRPYGNSAGNIRAYGWQPDSNQFAYSLENPLRTLLGDVKGNPPFEIVGINYEFIRWLDAERFLATQENNLYLGDIDGRKILIAEGVSDFDFGM